MNIKDAKIEIENSVRAYLIKDETGAYKIPVEKQRPLLLIGPPGIGKTAIMEQIAADLGINLVSYTITHHTRQSAIGLPYISKRIYGGKEQSVTEYTMSEIIASVYDQIERSGVQEGILFLDEINCVSETLAPTMLQFLQYKTFGTHRLPDGFLIVTAGNPPQYNKSVRDFDIVTLDRVRRLNITEDLAAWREYAYKAGVHGAILAYLEIRQDHFYSIRVDVEDRYFVTARGWEDLSRILYVYEELGIPVTANLVSEYLQDPEIAQDFATYYELYNKYKNIYKIPEILEGQYPANTDAFQNAPFDERLSLISLLIDALNQEFHTWAEDEDVQRELLEILQQLRTDLQAGKGGAKELLQASRQAREADLARRMEARMLDAGQVRIARRVIAEIAALEQHVTLEGSGEARSDFAIAKGWFDEREQARQARAQVAGGHLSHAFEFLSRTYGEGQEMVLFLSELASGYYSLRYVSECGNEAYYKYNKLLLLKERSDDLREEILQLQAL